MVATKHSNRKKRKNGTNSRYIGKLAGVIQHRVLAVGPHRFGIIAVDCAKRRSSWMLCDYLGRVIIEPTVVEHHSGTLKAMTQQVAAACKAEGILDSIVAVEMTGVYHKPIQAAFRKAGFDTRTIHPFASSHYRKPLHPNLKTDPNDLEAIFHAAVNGYGLAILPVDDTYQTLQRLTRHRRNLVKQRARLQVQIRALLHQSIPGYADLWEDDKLFNNSIAMPVAIRFSSADDIQHAKPLGMAKRLRESMVRFQAPTLDKIYAWSPASCPA